MKKIVIGALALCSIIKLNAEYVFTNFKVWDYAQKSAPNSIAINPDNPPKSFCIVIPSAHQPVFLRTHSKPDTPKIFSGQDVKFALGKEPLVMPKSFFYDGSVTIPTTVLILDWLDSGQTSDLESQASSAAMEIQQLMQKFPHAHYTLVGIGRGGLVMNKISHEENLPKQVTLIFLGSPFFNDKKKYPSYATLNESNVKQAYIFHNDLPYRPSSPLHPASGNLPQSAPAEKTYYIRTVANNKEQPVSNITFLTLQNVLDACAKVRTTYKNHHALWVSFSNMKPDTNGLAGISKNSSLNTPQTQLEKQTSNVNASIYNQNWNGTKILGTSPTSTRVRASYRLTKPKNTTL